MTASDIDGTVVRRIALHVGEEDATVAVLHHRDALIVAASIPEQDAVVERTLRFMLEPGPERLLPASLDERPLDIVAMPGEAFPTGGDVCAIVCPGELQAMAAELRLEITDVRLAYGGLRESPAFAVIAFEFPGADVRELIALREKLGRYDTSYERSELTIHGKAVRRYRDTVSRDPTQEQWEYAKDGVLYVLYSETTGNGVPPIVDEALGRLP